MPRYYFDIRNAEGFHRDDYGTDLANLEEAITQAQTLLPDLIREELPDGDWHDVACDVRDETDRVVYQAEVTYRGRRL